MDLKKFVDRYNDLASLFLQKFGEEAQDKNIVFFAFLHLFIVVDLVGCN